MKFHSFYHQGKFHNEFHEILTWAKMPAAMTTSMATMTMVVLVNLLWQVVGGGQYLCVCVCVCVPSAERVGIGRGGGVGRWDGSGMFKKARSPARPSRDNAVDEVSRHLRGGRCEEESNALLSSSTAAAGGVVRDGIG